MRRMLECGINVGIGTDGASSSDNLNMYEAMRIASLASKVRGPDWERGSRPRRCSEAATAGSAARSASTSSAAWLRLQGGHRVPRLGNVNWIPLNDAVNALVHTEDGSAVHSVMVRRRMVLENRRLVNLDLGGSHATRRARASAWSGSNRDNKPLRKARADRRQLLPALAKQPLPINRYAAWR